MQPVRTPASRRGVDRPITFSAKGSRRAVPGVQGRAATPLSSGPELFRYVFRPVANLERVDDIDDADNDQPPAGDQGQDPAIESSG